MEITPKVLEECVLPRVSKPNRYIYPWTAPQTEFAAAAGRVCVLAPAVYESALADPRFLSLAGWLTRAAGGPGTYVDVAFRPGADLVSVLRQSGAALFGLASARPLSAFDLVVVPIHDPIDLPTVAFLLDLGGVSAAVSERGASRPAVVIVGDLGLSPGAAPGIADRVAAGDPEAFTADLLSLAGRLAEAGDAAARRGALALFDGEGVWGSETPPRPRWLEEVPEGVFLGAPASEIDDDALFVEIARPRGVDDPVSPPPPLRTVPPDRVPPATEHGLVESGLSAVVFAGASAPRHPAVETILEEHHQRFGAHGVTGRTASVDAPHFTPGLARELRKGKPGRLDFDPVAASARLRESCGRPLSRADYVAAVETALRGGWGQIRLAFVLGLPGETATDREELLATVEEIRSLRPRGAAPSRLHLNLIPFSPVPGTPWSEARPGTAEDLAAVESQLRARGGKGGRLSVASESAARAAVRTRLWRATPELAPAVLRVARDARFGTDAEAAAWEEALAEAAPAPAGPFVTGPGATAATVPSGPTPARRTFGVPSWASSGRRPRREGKTGPGRRADRYRIRFSKSEPARFTSHLDVGRALERAFRRGQLPVAWTQGKEPRPRVAFGPPLPLGMTSDAEYLDVVFARDVPETFLGTMSDVLPEGLALTAAAPVRNEAASLASAIQFADYEVWFPDSLLEHDLAGVSFDGLKERLESRVAEVKASDTFEIIRVRKERTQTINARPSLKKMDVVRDDGGRPVLSLRLTLNQPDSIRPEPLTAALCDWVAFDERLLRVHRTGLHIPGKEGPLDPLDVVRADFAWWRQPIRGGTVL